MRVTVIGELLVRLRVAAGVLVRVELEEESGLRERLGTGVNDASARATNRVFPIRPRVLHDTLLLLITTLAKIAHELNCGLNEYTAQDAEQHAI